MDSVVVIILNGTSFVRDPCGRQNIKQAAKEPYTHYTGNFEDVISLA